MIKHIFFFISFVNDIFGYAKAHKKIYIFFGIIFILSNNDNVYELTAELLSA